MLKPNKIHNSGSELPFLSTGVIKGLIEMKNSSFSAMVTVDCRLHCVKLKLPSHEREIHKNLIQCNFIRLIVCLSVRCLFSLRSIRAALSCCWYKHSYPLLRFHIKSNWWKKAWPLLSRSHRKTSVFVFLFSKRNYSQTFFSFSVATHQFLYSRSVVFQTN